MPTTVFFLGPTKPLPSYDKASRHRRYNVIVKSREMTGRTHTLPWWLRGEEVKNRKTTENKIHWPRSLWYILKANQYCRRKPTAFVCSGRHEPSAPNGHYNLQRTVVKKTAPNSHYNLHRLFYLTRILMQQNRFGGRGAQEALKVLCRLISMPILDLCFFL